MLSEITLCAGLFHTATGTAFADIVIDGHRETLADPQQAISILAAAALLRGHGRRAECARPSGLHSICSRRGRSSMLRNGRFTSASPSTHGHIYLDLADEHWRAVVIGPEGWRVIGCPPVRFRRPAGMLPLPVPERGGSIEALGSVPQSVEPKRFCAGRGMALGNIAIRAVPIPLLAISGEQGLGQDRPIKTAQGVG